MPKITRGIVRFKTEIYPEKKALFEKLADSQNPEALFITCSDSRIDPNLMVQTEPGELFICRNAGNIVPPHTDHTGGVTATIEYAVAVLQVKHIIICGHTGCGALKGVIYPESVKDLTHVTQWLSYAKAAKHIVDAKSPHANDSDKLALLIQENVLLQLQHLKTHPHVAAKHATGRIQLHAWCYDVGCGEVVAFDDSKGCFVPVEEKYAAETKAFLEQRHQQQHQQQQ